MCGIFYTTLSGQKENFERIKHRGPDKTYWDGRLGFHRLSINDTSDAGDQPFERSGTRLVCNGEIWNHKDLEDRHDVVTLSNSDCEIIIHLYNKLGIEKTVKELDGDFAFIVTDGPKTVLARDRLGVRPLFYCFDDETGDLTVASEAKCFGGYNIPSQLPAGCYAIYDGINITIHEYYSLPNPSIYAAQPSIISVLLKHAVAKRLESDREIGCLLSGGLDSSIVAMLLAKLHNKKIKTFSIGFEDSTDLVNARKMAEFLGTDHHEFVITHEEALSSIPDTILSLETFDITTVRAGVCMWLLGKKIRETTDVKVVFSGEGSDELFAGYLYFHKCPGGNNLSEECKKLVTELPYFDVLRADRAISAHGLELRVPFLDIKVVNYAMSLKSDAKKPTKGFEKYWLRKAFEEDLPEEIAWRRKEAFSDAVSSKQCPWYKKIQSSMEQGLNESEYYKRTFYRHFPKDFVPIPHYWVVNWMENRDGLEPSAMEYFDLNGGALKYT